MRAAVTALFGFLVLPALGCLFTGEPTPTPSPTPVPYTSRIAFVSDRDGNWEIYLVNSDGSDLKNLSNNPALDGHPSWSPDGKQIVFYSDRDGNRNIYVMDSDGSNQIRLTDDTAADHSPAWSPDGSRIAFVTDRIGRTHIWIMDADGSNKSDLTPRLGRGARWPAWSPDSETIAYISRTNLYYIGSDGENAALIVDSDNFVLEGFFVGAPDWSPDGKRLALLANFRDRDGLIGRLYTADSEDAYNFMELLPLELRFRRNTEIEPTWPLDGPDERPTWSPDGTKIAYASLTDGDWEIWVADIEAETAVRLTEHEGMDSFPAWEPVGVVPADLGVVSVSATTTASLGR